MSSVAISHPEPLSTLINVVIEVQEDGTASISGVRIPRQLLPQLMWQPNNKVSEKNESRTNRASKFLISSLFCSALSRFICEHMALLYTLYAWETSTLTWPPFLNSNSQQ